LTATAVAICLAAAACSSPETDRRTADARDSDGSGAAAQRDADRLGRRVFQLLDQAASYRSSHRGRLPATVAQLGIDSLTPDMVQRLRARNDSSVARVAFRRPGGHALTWCEASTEALEEASLNAGAFTLWCERAGGATDSFTVGGAP
jgi:hypothetical protein